jgi:outer membrane immunogenic protein
MIYASPTSAAGDGRCQAMAARRRGRLLRACAMAGLLLATVTADRALAADWVDDSFLRGSLGTKGYSRWDGVNFGAQMGVGSMNTDFGNGTSSVVAFILRNSTLEDEFAPSNWTTLPSNTTNGRQYGAFLGYNFQWDQLVVGIDGAYNRASSIGSSATDSINRIVTTSDTVQHNVTINASSSLKLIDYATLRARAGYAIGQFLPYAVLGAAVGRFNYANAATVTDIQTVSGVVQPAFIQSGSNGKNSAITGGFVTGLGLDVAILPNMFLRAEWEFTAFAPLGGIRAAMNTGRVGLGVRF